MSRHRSAILVSLSCSLACQGQAIEASDESGSSGIVVGRDDSGSGTGRDDGGDDGADGSEDDGHTIVFDVGSPTGTVDCGDGEVGNSFSIIWIANSSQGTVSKIDTATATELARYRTGPDGSDPSRTAVSLSGDVAVSNRRGTVTKLAGTIERCVDGDGDGEIRTSRAWDDVLPWGEDECVLWHHDTGFDPGVAGSQGGPRATAWTRGSIDPATCDTVGEQLWISWRNQPASSATIRKLDGDLGTTLGEVVIEDWPDNWGHGPYGGAADVDGNLWALGTSGSMFRVDAETLAVDRWDNPVDHVMYGIALDGDGTPWVAGWSGKLWKFDREAGSWIDEGDTEGGPTRLRGLAIDRDGSAWVAGNNPCGLMRYDTVADVLVDGAIALPDCQEPVGVSVDAAGMVWVVDRGAARAYRVDPSDGSSVVVEGLVDPYTYSDMTGSGLGLVANPPG
ncbi:MAG: hypothetical protein IPH07_28300 [Deltaproteobacteria bacterium]|nr:hypothetical protein [Deltaproteobacteria bacterium]MBK8234077.1 hypothetical protein [Deltaproteobacteria bacterium]MBK8714800.1 hypothetical protein [Deltaproteobacteria bacterium]MBP7289523.1 hypothetical protein [Nannocystaceae bacterium]